MYNRNRQSTRIPAANIAVEEGILAVLGLVADLVTIVSGLVRGEPQGLVGDMI